MRGNQSNVVDFAVELGAELRVHNYGMDRLDYDFEIGLRNGHVTEIMGAGASAERRPYGEGFARPRSAGGRAVPRCAPHVRR